PASPVRVGVSTDGVLIANLYLPLSYTFERGGERMAIEEQTEYPFRYTVTFKVCGTGSFPFALRIPAYAKRYKVTRSNSESGYTVKDNVLFFETDVTGGEMITVEFFPEVNLLKAVDGTYALSFGTLLFSKDIPAVCKKYRKYEGAKGFFDCDFVPKIHEDWNDTLLVRGGVPEDAKIEYPEGKGYPLDEGNYPVISVKALDRYAYPVNLKLKPIGATTLRRTTFPVFEDSENIYKI
ncbi:MAG: glycoside hydrolase family 127 protein, partial [Clostridia bacterium]|nr:glycoside hydrolase family 127 protein [Clostridia bacterium]